MAPRPTVRMREELVREKRVVEREFGQRPVGEEREERTHDGSVDDLRMNQSQRLQIVLESVSNQDGVFVDELSERPPHTGDIQHSVLNFSLLDTREASIEVEHGSGGGRSDVFVEKDGARAREGGKAGERHARSCVDELRIEGEDVDGGRERQNRRGRPKRGGKDEGDAGMKDGGILVLRETMGKFERKKDEIKKTHLEDVRTDLARWSTG
jgi:hypothetical protein